MMVLSAHAMPSRSHSTSALSRAHMSLSMSCVCWPSRAMCSKIWPRSSRDCGSMTSEPSSISPLFKVVILLVGVDAVQVVQDLLERHVLLVEERQRRLALRAQCVVVVRLEQVVTDERRAAL